MSMADGNIIDSPPAYEKNSHEENVFSDQPQPAPLAQPAATERTKLVADGNITNAPPAYDKNSHRGNVHTDQPQPAPLAQPAATGGTAPNIVMATHRNGVTVITNLGLPVGEVPIQTTCSNCKNEIVTVVTEKAGMLCWFFTTTLCILGCCLCAWIPYVSKRCHDVVHTCPSCNIIVGRYRKGM